MRLALLVALGTLPSTAVVAAIATVAVTASVTTPVPVPTITVIHEQPGVAIEGEVEGLGVVPLETVQEGVVGGAWWAQMRVVADVEPTYRLRVRARDGARESVWSAWVEAIGPDLPDEMECANDDGAVGLDDINWVLGRVMQPGQVCVR